MAKRNMKKISLRQEHTGTIPIEELPTERLKAVHTSSSESPGSEENKSAFLTGAAIFFIVVQALLLARFLIHSILPVSNAFWINGIVTISGIFDFPFHLLFQWLALPIPGGIELYTLIAIFCYGLLSRLIARLYKAITPLL